MTEEERDERMAGHLDEMRRGGYRTGAGVIRHAEPETGYPQAWGSARPQAAQSHAETIRTAQASWDSQANALPGLHSGAAPNNPTAWRPSMDYPETWAPQPRKRDQ